MDGRFNGLVFAFCIMFCGIYSVSLNAATAGSAVFQAYSVLGKKRVGSNIRVDYAVKTNFEGSHIPRYKSVSVDYTPNDLAAMFASLKNKAPSSAVAVAGLGAIVGGAGWAIDELTGQITEPSSGTGSVSDHESGYYYKSNNPGVSSCISPEHCYISAPSSIDYFGNEYTRAESTTVNIYGVPSPAVYYRKGGAHQVVSWTRTPCGSSLAICQIDPDDIPIPIVDVPVSDSDFLEEAKKWVERAPLSTLDDLFRQPSGNPSPTEKLRNAIRDWLRDLADTSPDLTFSPPDTIVVTNPDGSTSDVTNTDPEEDTAATPSHPPGTAESQWPGFCEWATVICDWIDWTKEEPENMEPDELPVDELTVADLKKEYSSGLGSGSCPAPVSFTYQNQTSQFSYENACWAATNLFKPVLLTIAGIMAAFIIVGASRRAV